MTVSPREIGIGVVGFGTVGTGTVKLLLENAELLRKRVGIPVRLVRVADRDTAKDRGVRLPEGVRIVGLNRGGLEVPQKGELPVPTLTFTTSVEMGDVKFK